MKFVKVNKLYDESCDIGNTLLENVKEFTYLEKALNGAGSFQPAMDDKVNRAIFALNSSYKLNKLNLNIAFKLFGTMIMPILLCSYEVWGAYEYTLIKNPMKGENFMTEGVQTQFIIKHLIGVSQQINHLYNGTWRDRLLCPDCVHQIENCKSCQTPHVTTLLQIGSCDFTNNRK